MRSVIIGKSKTVVSPMPPNLLVVGGSFTGRLKIYDRDTLQEVTGVDTSVITTLNALAYDANYIYVGGVFPTSPYPLRRLSRSDKSWSAIADLTTGTTQSRGLCTDSSNIYVGCVARFYQAPVVGGVSKRVNVTNYAFTNLAQNDDTVYSYATYSTNCRIYSVRKSDWTAQKTLTLATATPRSLTADSNFLYFGSTNSGDFHVYDLGLTTEQTGYPTVPGGIYSILNDDTNIYIGSSSGNVYVINKATKALTTTVTGLGANIFSLSQTSDLLYIASATGIVKIGKSNLSTVYSVLNGLSSVKTIMVI